MRHFLIVFSCKNTLPTVLFIYDGRGSSDWLVLGQSQSRQGCRSFGTCFL